MAELKTCIHCNRDVDAAGNFCPYCGQGEFKEQAPDTNAAVVVPSQIVTPNGYVPLPYYDKLPPVPQKSAKTWGIWIILAFAFVVGVALGLLPTLSDRAVSEGYAKGLIDNGIYYNEWAEIVVDIPEGFVNATEEEYLTMESQSTDCGIYYYNPETGMIYNLLLEKVSALSGPDAQEYLSTICKQLSTLNEEGVSFNVPDTLEDIQIAGENYVVAHCAVTNPYASFTQSLYVRKVGNRMLCFMVTSSTAEENDQMLKSTVNNYTDWCGT